MSWPLYRGINEDDPCHNLGMHPSKRLGMEGRHGMGNKNNLPWLPNVPMPLNQTNEVGQARDFFIQLGIAPRPDSPTETWTVVGDDVDVLEATQPAGSRARWSSSPDVVARVRARAVELVGAHPLYPEVDLSS